MLIIGVHIPILLPIANLGLIIVDEEHEVGYQEKKHPKVNTKEAALMRRTLQKFLFYSVQQPHQFNHSISAKTKNWHIFLFA